MFASHAPVQISGCTLSAKVEEASAHPYHCPFHRPYPRHLLASARITMTD